MSKKTQKTYNYVNQKWFEIKKPGNKYPKGKVWYWWWIFVVKSNDLEQK